MLQVDSCLWSPNISCCTCDETNELDRTNHREWNPLHKLITTAIGTKPVVFNSYNKQKSGSGDKVLTLRSASLVGSRSRALWVRYDTTDKEWIPEFLCPPLPHQISRTRSGPMGGYRMHDVVIIWTVVIVPVKTYFVQDFLGWLSAWLSDQYVSGR